MDNSQREQLIKDLCELLKKHSLKEGCLFYISPTGPGCAHVGQKPYNATIDDIKQLGIAMIKGNIITLAIDLPISEAQQAEEQARRQSKLN